jgi:hypothetical protein
MSNQKDEVTQKIKAEFEKQANGHVFPSEMTMDSVCRITHLGIKDFELYSAVALHALLLRDGDHDLVAEKAQAWGFKLSQINANLSKELSDGVEFGKLSLNNVQKSIIAGESRTLSPSLQLVLIASNLFMSMNNIKRVGAWVAVALLILAIVLGFK